MERREFLLGVGETPIGGIHHEGGVRRGAEVFPPNNQSPKAWGSRDSTDGRGYCEDT